MQKQERSRVNFHLPVEMHKELKMQAVRLGVSVRELATKAIQEKIEALELQEEKEQLAKYHELMEKYEKGKLKTISHEEMIKRLT